MLRNLLPRRVRRTLGRLRDAALSRWFATRARQRLNRHSITRPHNLPSELIVSLTSYPPRFATLHLTLGCLLDQTVTADRTTLWIAHRDIDQLPTAVRSLEGRGLEIRACDDLRSYKKLIPALQAFPEAFIVTADDDAYYPRTWLEELVEGVAGAPGVIACHRAHRIKRAADGTLSSYLEWQFDVNDDAARRPSSDLVPTGAGGILYPPHCFDERVTDRRSFERLCPQGDDLWFYWCARAAGTLHNKVGPKMRLVTWPRSQNWSLWSANESENDRMSRHLEAEFEASM
jgi:hypothetical protein